MAAAAPASTAAAMATASRPGRRSATAGALVRGTLKALTVALRALLRPAAAAHLWKACPALGTFKRSLLLNHHWSSFENEHLGLQQGTSHLVTRPFDQSSKRRPGNAHALRGRVVVEPLEIREPQRFQFVETQLDRFELSPRDADRLERTDRRLRSDPAAFPGTRHGTQFPLGCYKHTLIIAGCQEPPVVFGDGPWAVGGSTLNMLLNAMDGLAPENVSIHDETGRQWSEPNDRGTLGGLTTHQLRMQQDVEQYLEKKAQNLVTDMVGANNARVQVSASINFDKVDRTTQAADHQPVILTLD
jgi:hypothetical protein